MKALRFIAAAVLQLFATVGVWHTFGTPVDLIGAVGWIALVLVMALLMAIVLAGNKP